MGAASRIVSLVPSLTETLFDLGSGERVVGVSDYCTSPPQASRVPQVGGPRSPDHAAIAALRPDLVVLSQEECCRDDFERFTQLCDVYVATCCSIRDGLEVILELGRRTGLIAVARELVCRLEGELEAVAVPAGAPTLPVFYPVWVDPWISVARGTFAADMLARAGAVSIFAGEAVAYPVVDLAEARRRDPRAILLPDEPYPFGPGDAERFAGFAAHARGAVRCVPGRWAAWYGARMAEGLRGLRAVVAACAG